MTLILPRRGFLQVLAGAIAAPIICRAELLMPVTRGEAVRLHGVRIIEYIGRNIQDGFFRWAACRGEHGSLELMRKLAANWPAPYTYSEFYIEADGIHCVNEGVRVRMLPDLAFLSPRRSLFAATTFREWVDAKAGR